MRRRALLASLTAGLGGLTGCSERLGDATTPTDQTTIPSSETPSATPTESPTADQTETATDTQTEPDWGFNQSSIVALDTADRTYVIDPTEYRTDDGGTVKLRFTSTATADHPATVEAILRNENPYENVFRLEWSPPFGGLVSDDPHPMGERDGDRTYRSGLVFAPTDDHELVEDGMTVTRASDGLWRLSETTAPEFPERVRLGPGESVRGEYALVGRSTGVGRGRPTGVYEFSRADERPLRVTVWQTSAPGPATASRFAGVSLPPLSESGDVAWFHEADETTPTFVRPSVERTELPARIEFSFLNRSRQTTECGGWSFYKLRDGQWFDLGPYVQTLACWLAPPGSARSWTLRAANGDIAPCEAQQYPFLGGGRYAATVGYGHATGVSGALVDIDAPPVTVAPTEDVTTESSGGVVTATAPRWRTAPEKEGRKRVTLELTRAESADERLIPEQVMRRYNRVLRNTLGFLAPDVNRVRLRTNEETAARVVGYDSTRYTFRLDRQAYALRQVS